MKETFEYPQKKLDSLADNCLSQQQSSHRHLHRYPITLKLVLSAVFVCGLLLGDVFCGHLPEWSLQKLEEKINGC